jgi:DNA sulfur modification protein DndC
MNYAVKENEGTVSLIQKEYLSSTNPWYIGFSGGKDSSTILKLTFLALMNLKYPQKMVTVLYCDTGVDIPIFASLVKRTLASIENEANSYGIPIKTKIAIPLIQDSFFSKVIGKGYPTPTNKFRWCTDRLRIKPINSVLKSTNSKLNIVLLGIRKGESIERDKIIVRHETGKDYYFRQSDNANTKIFAPIINYSTEDVWATIAYNPIPNSINAIELMALYRHSGSECPIIKDPRGSPCGKGRFGCWTCTVVRKDKAVQSLVNEGYDQLKPLLSFRNWLVQIRDNPTYRANKRRNGQVGLGPFTLSARKEILDKLLEAEHLSGYKLLTQEESNYIEACWIEDEGKWD